MLGEMYASQFAFDWFDKPPFGVRPVDNSVDKLRSLLRTP
jgi:hypothetical protein